MQGQRRRPFSSLLLGAVGKRSTTKLTAQLRPIPKEARSAAASPELEDSHSDVDTGSQVDDHDDEDSFVPEQTPPALESVCSKPNKVPPLKRCRSSPPTQELRNKLDDDNVLASPSAGSKSTALLTASVDGSSQQHTSQRREQSPAASPSPVQNCCAELRSDDDDATATGCCLLDLWAAAAPATSEPTGEPASSSSLTAPKPFAAISQGITASLAPEPAPVLQLAPPLKLSPRQPSHANSKRPRVSITLGTISAAPELDASCNRPPLPPRHTAMTYRPSASGKKRTKTPRFRPTAKTADASPQHASSSRQVPATDLTAWNPPTGSHNTGSLPLRGAGLSASAVRARRAADVEPLSPAPLDDLPMSVQMDRDIINTMLVTRRTSSRWSEYARDGAPWTLEEERWLMRHHEEGGTLVWLSEQLSRTRSAVKARLKRHG